MRYMTDDDEIFKTLEEAKAHEDELGLQAGLSSEVVAYLDANGYKVSEVDTPSERRLRTRAFNTIMAWLRYDRELHPERYAVAPEPPVVTAISGVE